MPKLALGADMRRRDFIPLVGGVAVWPLAVYAQQAKKMSRIGVLYAGADTDPDYQARLAVFKQTLQQLGWNEGSNVTVDYRWSAGDPERIRRYVTELVALAPDVIYANSTPLVIALQQATRTIPIVFAGVADPVGAGIVESLARPGGNATGFTLFEFGMSAKWLEILKQIAPGVTRVGVARDQSVAGIGQFAAVQSVAQSFRLDLQPIGVRDAEEIERAINAFVRGSNDGLIVTASILTSLHRSLIIRLAAKYRLPAVYSAPNFVAEGGLIAYGPDRVDQSRHAAEYIDRILRGEKAADLPVQAPTKFELVINLKTAKALGLAVPPALLSTATEIIE
jgi:putative tryptophan/tyrosine transport system substrate-binding protein